MNQVGLFSSDLSATTYQTFDIDTLALSAFFVQRCVARTSWLNETALFGITQPDAVTLHNQHSSPMIDYQIQYGLAIYMAD
jgi:hypothetical protein